MPEQRCVNTLGEDDPGNLVYNVVLLMLSIVSVVPCKALLGMAED